MRALVVHDSVLGNGRAVAEAIALGLSPTATTLVLPACDAPVDLGEDFDLVAAGGPNHAFGLPTPRSREDARSRGADAAVTGRGLREWLEVVTIGGGRPTWAVAWDTRLVHPAFLARLDHASATISRRLRRRGFELLADPEHFLVADMRGPLLDGELPRARSWGLELGSRLVGVTLSPTA